MRNTKYVGARVHYMLKGQARAAVITSEPSNPEVLNLAVFADSSDTISDAPFNGSPIALFSNVSHDEAGNNGTWSAFQITHGHLQ